MAAQTVAPRTGAWSSPSNLPQRVERAGNRRLRTVPCRARRNRLRAAARRSAVALVRDELAELAKLLGAHAAAPPRERDRAIALVAERIGLHLRALQQRGPHGHLRQERNTQVGVHHLDE